MLKIGQKIELIGKSKQRENELSFDGRKFIVLGIQLGKAFDDVDGPWYLIRQNGNYKWVHETDDKYYTIKELE